MKHLLLFLSVTIRVYLCSTNHKNITFTKFTDQTAGQSVGLEVVTNLMPFYREKLLTEADSYRYPSAVCRFQNVLGDVGSNFQAVILYFDDPVRATESFANFGSCNQSSNNSIEIISYPNLQLIYQLDSANLPALLKAIDEFQKYLQVQIIYLDCLSVSEQKDKSPQGILEAIRILVEIFKNTNIQLGCYLNYPEDFVTGNSHFNPYPSSIEEIHTQVSSVLSNFSMLIDLDGNESSVLLEFKGINQFKRYDMVISAANITDMFRAELIKQYPETTINIIIKPNELLADYPKYSLFGVSLNLFCHKTPKDLVAANEFLLNWGTKNDITIINQPLTDTIRDMGWYTDIHTDFLLERTATNFPVLVRRNIPESVKKLPQQYECITNIETPEIVHFETNQLSGVHISGTKLELQNSSQLRNYLLLAYAKFASVELSVDNTTLHLVQNSLNEYTLKALATKKPPGLNLRLYLEIENHEGVEQLIPLLNRASILPVSFHVSNWNQYTVADKKNLTQTFPKIIPSAEIFGAKHTFGISIQNCMQEINANFQTLKTFPYLANVSYLVCNENSRVPQNDDEEIVQLYLDTHFYISKYVKAKLGLDVIFRLNFHTQDCHSPTKQATSEYLRLLHKINQYSQIYGLRYFVGNAFKVVQSYPKNCSWGWWEVAHETSNISFTELESGNYNFLSL